LLVSFFYTFRRRTRRAGGGRALHCWLPFQLWRKTST